MNGAETDLTLEVANTGGSVTVNVAGEIDSSNCGQLEAALIGLSPAAGSRVDVDLGGVSFIDSSGLRALLTGQRAIEEQSASMRVVSPSTTVRRLFEITGLADRLL